MRGRGAGGGCLLVRSGRPRDGAAKAPLLSRDTGGHHTVRGVGKGVRFATVKAVKGVIIQRRRSRARLMDLYDYVAVFVMGPFITLNVPGRFVGSASGGLVQSLFSSGRVAVNSSRGTVAETERLILKRMSALVSFVFSRVGGRRGTVVGKDTSAGRGEGRKSVAGRWIVWNTLC